MHRLCLLMTLCAPLITGCGKPQRPITSADGLNRYGELSGIKDSHLQSLREEMARLESEQATASQFGGDSLTLPTSLGASTAKTLSTTDEYLEAIAALNAVFTPKQQETILKRLNELHPIGPFEFSSTELQTAIQFKDRYDSQRLRIHRLIGDLDRGFGIQLTQGLAADTSFTDLVTIGIRLDAIVAAELLYRDNPPAAVAIVREMTAAIEAMASEQHIVPRIAAVHRRGEVLRVLEAIAIHPKSTWETHRDLASIINDQLVGWPSDARAWIGDRAIGMHTFELVRDGYLLSILDDKEHSRLRREVGFERLAQQVADNLDRDELFYLKAMRRVISACERPYCERSRVFRDTDGELESQRDSLTYPLVTDLILWKDVQEGQRLQALDRARCEAWSIALATSVGAAPSSSRINPLTGTRYIIDLREDRVIVDGIDPDRGASPINIPRKPAPNTGQVDVKKPST